MYDDEFYEGNKVYVVRNWEKGNDGIPFNGISEDLFKAIQGQAGIIEEIEHPSYCFVKFPESVVPGRYLHIPFFALSKTNPYTKD